MCSDLSTYMNRRRSRSVPLPTRHRSFCRNWATTCALDAGVSPCTCYSCVGRRKDQKQQIEDTKALTDRVQ
jgi:hypothetical protein